MNAPIKLYLNAGQYKSPESENIDVFLIHGHTTIIPEFGNKIAYNYEETYILETEHERILTELKEKIDKLEKQLGK